jgi:hypothetical protein
MFCFKVDISSRKHQFPKPAMFGHYQNTCETEVMSQSSSNKIGFDSNGQPIMAYSPPVIPFVDPNQVALMQAVYTQLVCKSFHLNLKLCHLSPFFP